MLMTVNPQSEPSASRQTGQGLVMAADRTREFQKAARRTVIVRLLRLAFPGAVVALLGVYGFAIAQKTGLVSPDSLPEIALRQILPEDLAMTNPRYEGFGKDGMSYKFTAKTADPDLTNPNVVTLNSISGEIYQADKTRTDVTAARGVFNNNESVLELYEQIDVVSVSGLKAKLTRATILAKEDLRSRVSERHGSRKADDPAPEGARSDLHRRRAGRADTARRRPAEDRARRSPGCCGRITRRRSALHTVERPHPYQRAPSRHQRCE